jgi:hypothetical protein
MGFTAAGISTTTVTTTVQGQQAPLGFRLTVPTANDGNQTYTYIKAAAAVAIGEAVMKGAGTGISSGYGACILATQAALSPHRYVGCAQVAIPSGSYGFVLTRGVGTALIATTIAAGADLVIDGAAPGSLDDEAADDDTFRVGYAPAALAVGAVSGVFLDFLG